jgi:hypothetical protein
MCARSAVRSSFRPGLESLESRDLPSVLPSITRFILPVAAELAVNSSAALARLTADDNIRTSIVTAASHPTNNFAAAAFAQAAGALQEVLTERRVLEIHFLKDLNECKAIINAEDPASQAIDNAVLAHTILPRLNALRGQVIANENAALGLAIVNAGINTIGTPGFVTVTTGINSPVNIDITYPPLRPSLGAGIVSVPVFNYSHARWPFLPAHYVPPSNNP